MRCVDEPPPGQDAISPASVRSGPLAAAWKLESIPSRLINLAGRRILVVDDEADARDLLAEILGQAGADVTVVASAEDALETLRRQRPDVLLSDIGMPGDDGYALIRKVRALGPEQGGQVRAVAADGVRTVGRPRPRARGGVPRPHRRIAGLAPERRD